MELLKKRILDEGIVREGNILKVDSFLNHRLDPRLFMEMAKEFENYFIDRAPTLILTVEASGIAIAIVTGLEMGIPVLFAKKSDSKNLDGDVYHSAVRSYTRGSVYDVRVEKKFLPAKERVLIIDDFLARGAALGGLIDIVAQSGATLCGAGIAVEKGFQDGGRKLREAGVDICSLAVIKSMDENGILFEN